MRSMTSNQVSGDALIDAAEHGETVVVTRDGVPIGEFVPRPATAPEPTTIAERLAELERKYPPDPEFGDLLEEIHRELNESGGEVREW
jgi:antitoxin (DNA-binding transcriptional repressor) of toxin-antitoxin stability system